MKNSLHKCLFLDRDGIVNRDVGYAYLPEQIEFIPHIFELCRHFLQQGYLIIIVTNQSGIARGYYSEEDFELLNTWLTDRFKQEDITLTAIFHCPHHPDITGHCHCRKPEPGMLLDAIKQYRIDPQFSMMVGDKKSDMDAALAAGIHHRILVTTEPYTKAEAANATAVTSSLIDICTLDLSC